MRRPDKSVKKVGGKYFPAYMAGAYEAMREAAMSRARNLQFETSKKIAVAHARWCHREYMRKLKELEAAQ